MKHLLLFSFFSVSLLTVQKDVSAQTPFPDAEFIDVNNIKARIMVHGDMWHNPDSTYAQCEFPKGSGKNVGFAGAIWMAGYDNQGQLHAAAQTYRNNGIDFWPGPLDSFANGSVAPISYAKSQKWAKIWKVNRWEIESFLNTPNHTVSNIPASILEWPGSGNIYATGNGGVNLNLVPGGIYSYAPFINSPNDPGNDPNAYEPLRGDYPDIKGDQALWFIFNDYGPTHSATDTLPIKIGVSCLVYGYKRNTAIDNVVFYDYKTIYHGNIELDSFVMGVFADMDLGYGFDDYIGFDSSRNLGYTYNGDSFDGAGEPNSYGDSIPAVGIRILKWNYLDTCGANIPAQSFMAVNNSSDPVIGDPTTGDEFHNYLTSRWRNGQHLVNDYTGPGTPTGGSGNGSYPLANYIFPGNPSISSEWSECSSLNVPYDRRFVIAGAPEKVTPGSVQHFSFALIATPPKYGNACPTFSLADLQALADTAKEVFCNPLPVKTGIEDHFQSNQQLKIYPNPANDRLYIVSKDNLEGHVSVADALGRRMEVRLHQQGNTWELNTSAFAPGVYYLIVTDNGKSYATPFVKN
ncbi:MAG TPA: T9SS type A sorting domain-containing protein [Flavipsychrobacter sp.]|nr:T9SS type A sorting domain-containing protein [Flavipsychrobacter sp.]